MASPNREQLISFSGKDPERYYTGCVKTKFVCKLVEQCLPYWHSDRFMFTCTGRVGGRALCYKSEGRVFDSLWCHWNFSLTYFLGGKGGRAYGWNLTTFM